MELIAEAPGRFFTGMALDAHGDVFVICAFSGELLRLDKERKVLVPIMATEVSPHGIAIEPRSGSVFITDRGENAIVKLYCVETPATEEESGAKNPEEGAYSTVRYLNTFEGRPLRGPTAIAFSPSGELLFTDAGSEGDSSFSSPMGAVYRTVLGHERLLPICPHGLIRPSAIAVAPDSSVYVCEQGTNRVLRFVRRSTYFVGNVFAQLQGGMGPRAIAVSPKDGTIFVAQYELNSAESVEAGEEVEVEDVPESAKGVITVFGKDGEVQGIVRTPNPCITAVAIDDTGSTLYVIEGDEVAGRSWLYRINLAPGEMDSEQKNHAE
uniref:SMP-30/Gluconolactonase/LRE-like region domain-containing protein n=1 Tax=Trypanosoma congolense (strain IL3000) TaxID=1068625 RepID=G0USH8_TRYCI|nr:conserved hypothetical protein [Trypanosoma congolense IL3000]